MCELRLIGPLVYLRRKEDNMDRCGACNERVRCSACPDATTEDESRTPIVKGLRCFNYYDGQWGYVLTDPDDQGWFYHGRQEHIGTTRGTLLNGVRVSMYNPQNRSEC
jgi:hypothetical protein